jgi:hypothetical protein
MKVVITHLARTKLFFHLVFILGSPRQLVISDESHLFYQRFIPDPFLVIFSVVDL